jgi:hypothetical protein
MVDSTYEPVWCQWELPRSSMDARVSTLTGTLSIRGGRAELRTGDGVIPFQPVLAVLTGRRGSDFFNRWIELQYGDPEQPSTVYLNDGGWRGWRPVLARTNRKIVADLLSLTPSSG